MAHYAVLDESNIVTYVFVGRDEDDLVEGVTDWEEYYGAKRCSYNTRGGEHPEGSNKAFRKNYPGIGWLYDPVRDAFIGPQPFPSWVLNEQTCLYEPPIPYPGDAENIYRWDEDSVSWIYEPESPFAGAQQ